MDTNDIKDAVNRLDEYIKLDRINIKDLVNMVQDTLCDPEKKVIFEIWDCANEILKKSTQEQTKTEVAHNIELKQSDVMTVLSEIKDSINGLRHDLRADVSGMKDSMNGMNDSINGLRRDSQLWFNSQYPVPNIRLANLAAAESSIRGADFYPSREDVIEFGF